MRSDIADDVRGRGVSDDDATGNGRTGSGKGPDVADVQPPPPPPYPFPCVQSSRVEQMEVVEEKGKRKGKDGEEEEERQRGGFVNSLRSGVGRWVDGWMCFLREILLLVAEFNCGRRFRQMFSFESLKRKLPIISWISKYTLSDFQGDVIAGLTVGLTVIPQSLAYANIAKLKPHFGLYSAFMGCFVYVILGTSRDVTFGPTAVMSLLTAEFCSEGMADGDASLAVIMTLICGVVQIVMGLLHIGFLVDYISHPVINSFTTAAAITIACSQVKKWLGLKDVPRDFIPQFYETIRKIPETKVFDFLLGLICMILLYVMKKMKDWKIGKNSNPTKCLAVSKYLVWLSSTARNAIIVALASGVAGILWSFHLTDVFSLTKEIRQGFPPFSFPNIFNLTIGNETKTPMETIQTMGIGVVIVPLLGVIETIAIGKAFGRKHDYNIDANQELLAIGFSNILGSFVQSYPVTASFSRSAVNAQSGVRTPGGGIFTGALVLLALAFLTPVFYFIPNAGLAAVIIMAVTDMIDFSMVKKLWKTKKSDLVPWFISFFVSLIYGFEYGIMLGVAASLLILLHSWSRPKIQVKREEREELLGPEFDSSSDRGPAISVTMELMFPGMDHLQDVILKAAFSDSSPKSVSLDLSNVSDVDFTAVEGIKELQEIFSKRKAQLVITNAPRRVAQRLSAGNVRDIQTTEAESVGCQRKLFSDPMIACELEREQQPTTEEEKEEEGGGGEGDRPDSVAAAVTSCVEEEEKSGKRRTGSKSKLTRDGSVVIEIIASNDDVTDHPHDASV